MTVKHFFHQLLFYAALLTILPVCVLLLLKYQTMYTIEKLCMDNYIALLDQAAREMDKRIRVLDLCAAEMIINGGVGDLLSVSSPRQGGKAVYSIYKLGLLLKGFLPEFSLEDDFCCELQVLSRGNDLVFRGNAFISGLRFFFETAVYYPQIGFETWMKGLFARTERSFIPSQTVYLDGRKTTAATYVVPITYGPGAKEAKGAIAFVIESKDMWKILNATNIGNSAEIYVLDASGNPVYHTHGILPERDLLLARMTEMGNSGFLETEDGKSLFAYIRSEYNGYLYVALVSKTVILARMYEVNRTMDITLCVYVFLSAALALAVAYRMSRPMRTLVASLASVLTGSGPSIGDMEFIEQGLCYLMLANKSLKKQEERKAAALADIALERLLNGQARRDDNSLQMLEGFHFPETWAFCCAAALRLPCPISQTVETLEKLKKNIGKIAGNGLFLHLRLMGESFIAAVFMFQEGNLMETGPRMRETLYALDGLIFEETGAHVWMGIGRMYADLYSLYFSYGQAVSSAEAAHGDFAGESPPCIRMYDEASRGSQTRFYPLDLEYRLANCVKAGDVSETRAALDRVIEENFTARVLPLGVQRQLCYDVCSTLQDVSLELRDTRAREAADAALEKIENHAEARDVLGELYAAFLQTAGETANRKRSHNSELKDRILRYFHENYADPQICVAQMAAKFSLSESYLSQFFKMQTGENISDYLERLRIDEAKRLMAQGSALIGIEALGVRVGYSNANTFRRAFKRVTGISPSEYRYGFFRSGTESLS
jgi:AraC-like DNA-binding protein